MVASMPRAKDESIETLRGLAILLVIAGYATLGELHTHSPFSTVMSFLYHLLTPIRMPLFTVISGYLYAASPASRDSYGKLVQGKARRILWPFAAMSAIQYLAYSSLEGGPSVAGLASVYVEPAHQLWFLMAVYWIFLLVGLADALGALASFKRWALAVCATVLLHIFTDLPSILSAGGAVYLTPFFLLGYGMRRFPHILLRPRSLPAYAAVSAAAYLVFGGLYVDPDVAKPVYEMLGCVISFTAIPAMFILRRSYWLLSVFGNYAFIIHLFSYLALLLAKISFASLGVTDDITWFIGTTVLVLGAPMLLQAPLERWDLTRRFLLGMKPRTTQDEPLSIPQKIKIPIQWRRKFVEMDRQCFRMRTRSRLWANAQRSRQKQLIDI
jgi:fucose 4-O-acetylase-like acetyltransferase